MATQSPLCNAGVSREQWLFALATTFTLLALGGWMLFIGSNGVALLALGLLVGGFNTYSYYDSYYRQRSSQPPAQLQFRPLLVASNDARKFSDLRGSE